MTNTTQDLQQKGVELLTSMIDTTIKGMNDVVEFSKQQIPDILHQLLMWKMAEAAFYAIGSLIGVIIIYFFVKKCFSKEWVKLTDDFSMAGGVIGGIISIGLVINAYANIMTVVNIFIAPKVYLIVFASQLIN